MPVNSACLPHTLNPIQFNLSFNQIPFFFFFGGVSTYNLSKTGLPLLLLQLLLLLLHLLLHKKKIKTDTTLDTTTMMSSVRVTPPISYSGPIQLFIYLRCPRLLPFGYFTALYTCSENPSKKLQCTGKKK